MRLTPSDEARFWAKTDRRGSDDCWPWLAYRSRKGYGVFSVAGKNIGAHRVSLSIKMGREVQLHALHTCDNASCVNPDHLYEGTNADNMRDKKERGRCAPSRGFDNPNCKLDAKGVQRIKRRLAAGDRRASIASDSGVSISTVHHIATGRKWADVQA